MIKKYIIMAIDWYVRNYHSVDYIHRDMIKDEIARRIEASEIRLNSHRDRQEYERLEAMKMQHAIVEDGYIAEITRLEKVVDDACLMRKEVEELYFKVARRAKELALITAENQYEGIKIINDVSASIGRIDIIARGSAELVKEIEEAKRSDHETLRIR